MQVTFASVFLTEEEVNLLSRKRFLLFSSVRRIVEFAHVIAAGSNSIAD